MRSLPLPQAESRRDRPSLLQWRLMTRPVTVVLSAVWALLTVVALFSGARVSAQTNGAQANSAPAQAAAPVHKHVRPRKKPAAAAHAPQPAPPPAPVVPPPPNWPANDLPAAASVVFDSRGLFIVASNSSLAQILKEVSTETGVKVEGMEADQRIFGTYGPGPARDVLSHLLDGSGYDFLMIGERGEGTPRRIVLTAETGGATKTTANNAQPQPSNQDTDVDQSAPEPEAEQEPPQPIQNGAGPPVPVRTPQQMIEEIRERQHEQQQNGQQNPQN